MTDTHAATTVATPGGLVDLADHQAITDLLARYCWAFDEGDADGYVALWTEDGVMTGFGDPIRGEAGLRAVVAGTIAQSGGKWRHSLANVVIRYGGGRDRATAKGYNLVTRFGDAPAVQSMVLAGFGLVRSDDGWKVGALDLAFA